MDEGVAMCFSRLQTQQVNDSMGEMLNLLMSVSQGKQRHREYDVNVMKVVVWTRPPGVRTRIEYPMAYSFVVDCEKAQHVLSIAGGISRMSSLQGSAFCASF